MLKRYVNNFNTSPMEKTDKLKSFDDFSDEATIKKNRKKRKKNYFQKENKFYRNKQTACEKGGATVGVRRLFD